MRYHRTEVSDMGPTTKTTNFSKNSMLANRLLYACILIKANNVGSKLKKIEVLFLNDILLVNSSQIHQNKHASMI